MKKGHYGIYKGKEYKIHFNADDTVNLISNNISDRDQGFKQSLEGDFVKTLKVSELEKAYSIHPQAKFRGVEVAVINEQGDDVLISGDGDYEAMIALGFKYLERGVYERWTKKEQIEKLWEEETPLNLS